MVNIKLGNTTYEEVSKIRFDKSEGGYQEFVLYDDAFEDGRVKGEEEGYREGYDVGKSDGHVEGFEAGKTEGYAEGKQAGIDEGVKTEYDRFWDAYQKNGRRTNYDYAFTRWAAEAFRPKYSIAPTGPADHMFWECGIGDLAAILRKQNVTMDTSDATSVNYMFAGSAMTHIPEVSLLSAGNGAFAVFNYNVNLVEIEKVILKDDGAMTFVLWFEMCNKLTRITFEGVIGQDINFQWSPLSATSINSVITHLSDTATGKTATFMRSAVNTAFETAAGAADGATSQVWLDLIATKPNWTISLV